MARKNEQNGCAIAVAIAGGLVVMVLVGLAVTFYVLASRFTETPLPGQAASASASASASSADTPDLAQLPSPAILTHGHFIRDDAMTFRGQYPVTGIVMVDKYRLTRLVVASNDDLRTFEAGKGPVMTPPLMLAFTTAPAGQDGPEIQVPLTLDSYSLTRDGVAFAAHSAQLGTVSFKGTWQEMRFLRVLNDPNRTPGFRDSGVISGDLTVSGKVYQGADFGYMIQ